MKGSKSTRGNNIAAMEDIARVLGISVDTVRRTISSAARKLAVWPHVEVILPCVRAVAEERDVLQPQSVECQIARGEWVPWR